MRAAQETARQQEAAAKKKHCENKTQALADAEIAKKHIAL